MIKPKREFIKHGIYFGLGLLFFLRWIPYIDDDLSMILGVFWMVTGTIGIYMAYRLAALRDVLDQIKKRREDRESASPDD